MANEKDTWQGEAVTDARPPTPKAGVTEAKEAKEATEAKEGLEDDEENMREKREAAAEAHRERAATGQPPFGKKL